MDPQRMISGDSTLIEKIVNYLKSKGIFDEFRHECLADVDTKSSCQNLSQRVDGYAAKFLSNETWHADMNKNELRNKLRRHIDESGMLAVGADHVVEQVINPKIHQLFLPKIMEVVHQYMKEQNDLLNKKPETSFSDNSTSENVPDAPDSNKGKTSALDPIADILSFSSVKSKTSSASGNITPSKLDNVLSKHTDVSKTEKKKEEKSIPISEKNVLESPSESSTILSVTEGKFQTDKEKDKIKKEEPESSLEITKKAVKDESKTDKKKSEEVKPQTTEINTNAEENKLSTSVSAKPISSGSKDAEENKASTPVSIKSSSTIKKEVEESKASASASSKASSSSKKDIDKSKLKSKSSNTHKTPSSSSGEVKKPKKESSDKSSDKNLKPKSSKPSKDVSSPSKSISSTKNILKEDKGGEGSKSKSSDSSSSKTSESSMKKHSKSSSSKKDHVSSKHKTLIEKTEKYKITKTSDKNEQNATESSSSEKGKKNTHYSSSYDSSQGSDQDKSSTSSKDRQKHFSKHAKKESSEKSSSKSSDTSSQKRKVKNADESPTKKIKNEAQEKFKESVTLGEAAKISSRSNSFGSTSSISSSSNTSKDNVISNSDETSESGGKDKKKKQSKDKEACHNLKSLPPPPPPPPPSSSLSCELTSADISSVEDTQSSSDHEHSSSGESSDDSSSDSEPETKESALNTLNETLLNHSSSDDINEFYDIFLYSSSSSEFEGFADSPEKPTHPERINESDVSVSSVHTSDLSSFDDELSDDDFFINNESQPGVKKRLTLKEAEKLLKSKAFLQSFDKNKSTPVKSKLDDVSSNNTSTQKSSRLSSEDESSPCEPKRSLRRERKLNPRYASSEYTSIFNSRKETFITKQSSPYVKTQALNSSPKSESKQKKESNADTDKSVKKNLQTKADTSHQDKVERSLRTRRKSSATVEEDKIFSENSKMSSSDELDSFIDKDKLFRGNDKSCQISDSENFKRHFKFKSQSNSHFSINSYSVKRKLTEAEETAAPAKRPCSRASMDSSSSECVPNENKPFNREKNSSSDDKMTKGSNFKGSDLADTIKKDMFCKQRTNNNGDILGQKDIFSKPLRGRVVNTSEKKCEETENSKELNAL